MNVGTLVAELKADISNFEKEINKSKKKLDELGKKVGSESKKMNKGFTRAMDGMGSRMKKFSNATRTLRYAILGLGTAGAILGTKFVVGVASDMEQTKVAFDTMLGSAKKSSKMLKKLSDFAVKTPFDLPEVFKGAKGLLAYGIEAKNIIPTLKSLGDVSAGLSVPMERLILNYGQVRAQGKLTGRELRDFAVAGVPMIAELAKIFGVAEKEVAGLVSTGKVGFPEVEKAFANMTGEGGRFEDLMKKQAKTFKGYVSNIKDSAVRISMDLMGLSTDIENYGEVIKGGLFDRIKGGAESALKWIEEHGEEIRAFTSDVGKKIGDTAVKVANLVKAFTKMDPATRNLILKMVALGMAFVVLAPVLEKMFVGLKGVGYLIKFVAPLFGGAIASLAGTAGVLIAIGVGLGILGKKIASLVTKATGLKKLGDIAGTIIGGPFFLMFEMFGRIKNLPAEFEQLKIFITETLPNFFKTLGDRVIGFISGLPSKVFNIFMQLPGKMAYAVGFALGLVARGILKGATLIVKGAIALGVGIYNGVKFMLTKLPGKVWGIIKSIPDWLRRAIPALKEAARNLGTKIVVGMINLIKTLPVKIGAWLNKLPAKLGEFANTLWEAAKNLGSKVWEGFKEGLGISSPSYIEQALMQIEEQAKTTKKNLATSVDELNSIIQPNIALSPASPGVNKTIKIYATVDSQDRLDQLERTVRRVNKEDMQSVEEGGF